MLIFTAQVYIELCLKWLYLFNRAFALTISQTGYQILFVTSSNGWWQDPTTQKSAVSTPNCWTRLAHSILIRLKQALILQNTKIWTLCKLLRVIKRKCIALLILLSYFVFEITLYIRIWKKVFTYVHLSPYGISFDLRNVFYSKE